MDHFPDVSDLGDLRFRRPQEADIPVLIQQFSDDRVAKWLAAIGRPFDAAAAREVLAHGAHPGEVLRLIERNGEVAGGFCLGASLWYWLAPTYWRQGLMQRTLTHAIQTRFARPAPPIIATCHADNTASRALLTGLGFARLPRQRRMFFHGSQSSEPCHDYVMAPEQWHLLHPPVLTAGRTTLRPASQRDAPLLARMLPPAGTTPWPATEALPAFIETHRFRGPRQGVFLIEDDNRRTVGAALLHGGATALRFLSPEDEARCRAGAEAALNGVQRS